MNMFLNFFQEISAAVIEAFCCKMFFQIFLLSKVNKKWEDKLLIVMLAFVEYSTTLILQEQLLVKIIIVFLLTTFIVHYYFYSSIYIKVLLSALFQSMLIGIDYLFAILIGKFFLWDIPDNLLFTLTCKVILLSIIVLTKKVWNKEKFLNVLSKEECIRLLYFPSMTLIILISMIYNFRAIDNRNIMNTVIITAITLIGMNILVIHIIKDFLEREIKIKENHIFEERIKSQNDIYKVMLTNFENQKKQTHEYKNHMECIEGMLKGENIKAAMEYITNITGKLENLDIIDTNNITVNTILNTKYHEANSKKIAFILKANDLSRLILKNEDMVIILSNLLNNAIEACDKCMHEKVIWTKIIDDSKMTIISVKNSISKKAVVLNGEFISNKKDIMNHGIGINNIKETVKKYGGSCLIKQNDKYFYFTIMIIHS